MATSDLLFTKDELKIIIDSFPGLELIQVRNEHFIDIYSSYYDDEIHLKFGSTSAITASELIPKLVKIIQNYYYSAGQTSKAIEIKKALYINE